MWFAIFTYLNERANGYMHNPVCNTHIINHITNQQFRIVNNKQRHDYKAVIGTKIYSDMSTMYAQFSGTDLILVFHMNITHCFKTLILDWMF